MDTISEDVNEGVGCNVEECRHNRAGKACSLCRIHVGKCCGEKTTCCDSYEER